MTPRTPPQTPRRTAPPTAIRAALAYLLVLSAAHPATAVTPALIVDADLNTEKVTLQSVSDGVVSYFGPDRQLRGDPLERFVQLRFLHTQAGRGDQAPSKADAGYIHLTDGQHLPGRWVAPGSDGETIRWRHPALGTAQVPLDKVASVLLDPQSTVPPADEGHDVLKLNNGDSVVGFVVSVESAGIRLLPTGRDEDMLIPIDRIAALRLTNTAAPAARSAHRLSLRDGTRLHAGSFTVTDDQITLTAAELFDQRLTIPLDTADRVDTAASGAHIIDLAELPMTTIAGGRVFGVPMMPSVRDGVVRLHAPVVVEFALPPGAARIAMTAQLDIDYPSGRRPVSRWPDLQLILSTPSDRSPPLRLNAEQPSTDINQPITGGTLKIEVTPGLHGPVLDRLRLTDAVVLVRDDR